MVESFSKIKNGLGGMVRLARALPEFLRDQITLPRAEAEIREGIERRGENFLDLARTRIYADPASPYLRLLKLAGCEFSDLRAAVLADGPEAALGRLAAAGVYLTADEFRGRKEVARGGESFRILPGEFRRPDAGAGFIAQSSGSSNLPTRSIVSLEWLALRAYATCVFFAAHDLFSSVHALYDAMLPGSGGVNNLLTAAKVGVRFDRWFARKVPVAGRLQSAHHLAATYLILAAGRCFGVGMPKPELAGPEDVETIVRWTAERLARGEKCCINAVASNAVRIAAAAAAMGESLAGTKFIVHGEPFTESKRAILERAGAGFALRYSFAPGFYVGSGCARPLHLDEVHLNQYLLAVARRRLFLSPDAAVDALLFTTLDPAAPELLLNVENGDYATVERRDCGCALEKAGLTLHLHHIRSHEKFTSEGMNYFYGGLLEVVEKILPAEFGGGPGDYQLVEEEDEKGQTRLTLRVHPGAGAVDEPRLLARLRAEIGRGAWGREFQARVWDGAGTLRVRREAPLASGRGKILPLHIRKKTE